MSVGCLHSASAPDLPASSEPAGRSGLLGAWIGSVSNDVAGQGAATLVFDTERATPTVPLVSGTWSFVFADGRFTSAGPLAANVGPGGASVVVFLDRVPLPCPAAPGGVAKPAVAVVLSRTGNRLLGEYIAGDCPGGRIDLVRQ